MHITLKNAELLKHSKLDKNAPTCFGLRRNHLQGVKVSAWLKITHYCKRKQNLVKKWSYERSSWGKP